MPDAVQTTSALLWAAASLAVVHTLLGIDHSLPLAALGRARGWALGRTLLVTGVCGAGHVASSVVLGAAGVGLGVATDSLLRIESARGELAAALLLGFGLAYTAWALRPRRCRPGSAGAPAQATGNGPVADGGRGDIRGVTAWALFVVFVLGPCEPLIPLMVVPGLAGDWLTAAAVAAVFGLLTVGVMLATVAAAWHGIGRLGGPGRAGRDRLAHAAAGLVVTASGAAVLWLGL